MVLILILIIISLFVYQLNRKTILKFFYPIKFQDYVYKYSDEYKIDPILVFAIIRAESNNDQFAVSQKGAKGLMQITDRTGMWAAESIGIENYSTANLFLPDVNIRIGCWYINRLRNEFDGNMFLAITAYNSGSGRVNEWLRDKKMEPSIKSVDMIPYTETKEYVKKVFKEYKILKYIYGQ